MAADASGPIDDPLGAEADVWARQVVDAKRRLKKPAPSAVDLAAAIIDVDITDVMKGSSTIVLTVADPDQELLDNGFFDPDDDGRLDRIDVNYPDGSRLWWRLTQAGIDGRTIELTFMERGAVLMMGHHGPLKASRAKKTRAEFIKSLADKVKAGGGITFHSGELHDKQKVAGDKPDAQRKADKDPGISPDARMRIAGADANAGQKRQVERALHVARDLNAPELAVLALMCAGIGESNFRAIRNQGNPPSRYWGVFQGSMDVFAIDDTEEMAKCFLKGGKGFQGGGAIALANAHPDWGPGLIAVTVEGSRSNFASDAAAERHYGKWKREAELLVEAYAGTSFGGTIYRKQFNFEVGSADDPHEDFWDAANRLAEDVNWALFLDGNDLYFDSEMWLIRQRPAAVIARDSATVVNFSVTWDNRHIATEVTLDLVCDPFEFRAGEVFKLEGFGPASSGSTAKPKPLPGRWLISEAERKPHELVTSFTLKQPTRAKREPVADQAERSDPASSGGDVSGTPKDVIDTAVLPIARDVGIQVTPESVTAANARHGHTVGGQVSDHEGPPDHAWAADMGIGPDIRGGGNAAGAAKGDKLAKALQRKFDMPDWKGLVSKEQSFGGRRYRFQLIWRFDSAQAGNHFTHVHFGVKRIGKFDDTPTTPTPSTPTPTSGTTPLP